MLRFLIPLLFLFTACGTTKSVAEEPGPATVPALNTYLDQTFDAAPVAGLSAVVCTAEGIVYQRSFGKADLAAGRAFDEHTVVNIASISKTFLAVATMKAVDQGKLSLDDDVNKYLPFKVANPHFPGAVITVRHLLTHTSSIEDTKAYAHAYYFHDAKTMDKERIAKDMRRYWKILRDNELMDDSDLLRHILTPAGDFYGKDAYSKKHKPGAEPSYSNVAASLGALVLEGATGMRYEDYTRKEIFEPLGMTESWWDGETIPAGRFAKRYYSPTWPVPDYSLLTLADGGLKTTTSDMAKYAVEMIRGYHNDGSLLSESAYKTMFSPQVKYGWRDLGIIWELGGENPGFSHNGGDPGVVSNLVYDAEKKRAVIMICNTDMNGKTFPSLARIWTTVEEFDFSGIAPVKK